MKKCPNPSCGVDNYDDAVFCRACGRSLNNNSGLTILISVLLIMALIISFFVAMNHRGADIDVRATIYITSVILSVFYLLFIKVDSNSIKIFVKTSIILSAIGFAFACLHCLITGQDNFEAGVVAVVSFIIELFIYLKMKGNSK